MEELNRAYEEHALAATRYEERQARLAMLMIVICGFLVSVISLASLSVWSLAPSVLLVLFGVGALFTSYKLRERCAFHTEIKLRIRGAADALRIDDSATYESISRLEEQAAASHYNNFLWPGYRQSKSEIGRRAANPFALKQLSFFWDALLWVCILSGVALSIFLLILHAG